MFSVLKYICTGHGSFVKDPRKRKTGEGKDRKINKEGTYEG
jgi:hypothetical protein